MESVRDAKEKKYMLRYYNYSVQPVDSEGYYFYTLIAINDVDWQTNERKEWNKAALA